MDYQLQSRIACEGLPCLLFPKAVRSKKTRLLRRDAFKNKASKRRVAQVTLEVTGDLGSAEVV